MAVYTLGLASIEMGAVGSDGGMGTSLAQLGYTNKDSCSFTQEDPETEEFYAEEVDDPVVSISRAGKKTFNFSVMNPDVEVLTALLGGTSSGTGDAAVWSAPDTIILRISQNQCLHLTFQEDRPICLFCSGASPDPKNRNPCVF
jgi:hypothetical protein